MCPHTLYTRRVVNAFRWYEQDALAEIHRWESNYELLSPRHK